MPGKKDRPRVLVVDDDPAFLDLMRRRLSEGHDVFCSKDGECVLQDLDAFRPDLVVLDVHMPEPDGFAVCRRIRASRTHREVPVLFLTASREDADFMEHLTARGNAYLDKAVDAADVLKAVKDMITRWPVRAMVTEE